MIRTTTFRIGLALLILGSLSTAAWAQGRGRGVGLQRRNDVFSQPDTRINGRGHNQDWKCSVFVNCHDARDGRLDGRGPRVSRLNRNNAFVSRGSRVGYQRRYNMNDYWSRRHVTDVRNWRYHGRMSRNR